MQIQSLKTEENMTKFLNTQPKSTNIDDLRLDAIIKEGTEGDIVIIGCPFDYVRKRAIGKGGEENGPCCIRRFFYKVGPLYNSEYEINISNIKVSDYGNVCISAEESHCPQKVIGKISNQVFNIIKNNKLPFVFGGSKQSSLACARAFHQSYKNGRHLIIAGLPFMKRPFDNDKLTSENLMTILELQFPQKQILFSPHQNYLPKNWNTTIQFIGYNEVYEKNEQGEKQWKLGFTSQPVKKLSKILRKQTNYHVTLSVDAIERFCGCRDLPVHGIKPQEMTQIFLWFGEQKNIKSIDITEFNPSCEDYESSLILLNFLYYFLMGWSKKYQN